MNGIEDLPAKTAAVFLTEIARETARTVTTWLQRRASPRTVEAARRFAANPVDGEARASLVDCLRRELEASPHLARELRDLLDATDVRHAPQSADITGDSATVIQIQGDRNRT